MGQETAEECGSGEVKICVPISPRANLERDVETRPDIEQAVGVIAHAHEDIEVFVELILRGNRPGECPLFTHRRLGVGKDFRIHAPLVRDLTLDR